MLNMPLLRIVFLLYIFSARSTIIFQITWLARCGRRGHQNLLGTFDRHGTGAERMFGEILGPWRDSQDSIFWYIHGVYTFQAILSNFQVSDGTKDLPRNHPHNDPLFKVRPLLDMMDTNFVQSYNCGRDLSFNEGCCPYKTKFRFGATILVNLISGI